MGLFGLFGGTGNTGEKVGGREIGQIQQFTPEQMGLFRQMFSHVGPDSFTSKLARGDQGMFNQLESPALQQFAGMQGNLASRFSGMGSGARRSSGFQNESNQAASSFAQQLQANRLGLQRNALQDLMSMSNSILGQQPFNRFQIEPNNKKSFLQQLIGGVAPIAGAVGGGYFGGPQGAQTGYQVGNAVAQAFY